MKIKLVQTRDGLSCVAVYHVPSGQWVPLHPAISRLPASYFLEGMKEKFLENTKAVIPFLQNYYKMQVALEDILDEFVAENKNINELYDEHVILKPFDPVSIRDASVFETHGIAAARNLVKNFAALPVRAIASMYELLTFSTFPPFRPPKTFSQKPVQYAQNHMNVYTNGQTIPVPSYVDYLDYELELGVIVAQQIRNATAEQARYAIGGFVIYNDWSCRNTQLEEALVSRFGFDKSKNFANAISNIVVTPEEIIDNTRSKFELRKLTATVHVNNQKYGSGTTDGMQHTVEELVSYASYGTTLYPGELIGTGTIAGCAGIEVNKRLKTGDVVKLELDGIGVLENTVGERENFPADHWKRKDSKKPSKALALVGKLFMLILLIAMIAGYVSVYSPIDPLPTDFSKYKSHRIEDYSIPVHFVQEMQHFYNGSLVPESFAVDTQGNMYCGGKNDGTIRRIYNINPATGTYETEIIAQLPAKALGLRRSKVDPNIILVGATHSGLYEVNIATKKVKPLAIEFQGEPFMFVNSVVQDSKGNIYFTESSNKFGVEYDHYDILESRPHGRLFKIDAMTQSLSLIWDDIHFANGIAINNQETKIYVAETVRGKIRVANLDNLKEWKYLLADDELNCIPDNLKVSSSNRLWISCAATINPLQKFILSQPALKKLVASLPTIVYTTVRSKVGMNAVYNLNEEKLESVVYDPQARYNSISEVFVHDGYGYIGSFFNQVLARFKLPKVYENESVEY